MAKSGPKSGSRAKSIGSPRKKKKEKKTTTAKTTGRRASSRTGTRRYGTLASKKVEETMRERKRGTLRSGGSGRRVKSRKQAIAIGLSKACKAGAKVPPEPAE